MSWRPSLKAKMDSAVNSISLSANRSELIVGCSSGSIYRCLARTLASHIVSEGHTSGITTIAFNTPESGSSGQGSSLIFASGTQSGWYCCLPAPHPSTSSLSLFSHIYLFVQLPTFITYFLLTSTSSSLLIASLTSTLHPSIFPCILLSHNIFSYIHLLLCHLLSTQANYGYGICLITPV